MMSSRNDLESDPEVHAAYLLNNLGGSLQCES